MMIFLAKRWSHRLNIPREMRNILRQDYFLVRCKSDKTTTKTTSTITSRIWNSQFTQRFSSLVSQWFHLGSNNKCFDTATNAALSNIAKAKEILNTTLTIIPSFSSTRSFPPITTRLVQHGTTIMTNTISKVTQASSKLGVIQKWQTRIQAYFGSAMSRHIAFQQQCRQLSQTVRSKRDQALQWFFVWSLAAIGVYGVATTLPKELLHYAMTKDSSTPATEDANKTIDKTNHQYSIERYTQTVINYLRNMFVGWEK